MAIRLERTDSVATIVMDRPEARNAVDGSAARALADAFREFEADDALRVAVLWGAGGVFCAGADLKARGTELGLRLSPEGDGPMGPSRMVFSKPTIAAVEGYAVAGGLELALMCDLRVASESAVFGVFCRRWGVPLIDGGTVRLPQLIGLSRALDMILTGRPVDANEALTFGLANRVVAESAVLEKRRSRWREPSPGFRPAASGAIVAQRGRAWGFRSPPPSPTSFPSARPRSTRARARRALSVSRRVLVVTDSSDGRQSDFGARLRLTNAVIRRRGSSVR